MYHSMGIAMVKVGFPGSNSLYTMPPGRDKEKPRGLERSLKTPCSDLAVTERSLI